jgi:hypothetical protein
MVLAVQELSTENLARHEFRCQRERVPTLIESTVSLRLERFTALYWSVHRCFSLQEFDLCMQNIVSCAQKITDIWRSRHSSGVRPDSVYVLRQEWAKFAKRGIPMRLIGRDSGRNRSELSGFICLDVATFANCPAVPQAAA